MEELQAATEEELQLARGEATRLRERLALMAKAKQTLKRRLQSLSLETSKQEREDHLLPCRHLCTVL